MRCVSSVTRRDRRRGGRPSVPGQARRQTARWIQLCIPNYYSRLTSTGKGAWHQSGMVNKG